MDIIWGSGRIINFMVKASSILKMDHIIRALFRKDMRLGKAGTSTTMAVYTKEPSATTKPTATAFTTTHSKATTTKDNGYKTLLQD